MRPLQALAGLVVIIGLAVPAQADPSSTDPGLDATFLDSLNKAGMTYRNGPDAVAAGRMACDLMDQGEPEFQVIQRVTALNPGLGLPGATRFTAIASSVYCPQYLDKSSAKTTSPPAFPGLPGR